MSGGAVIVGEYEAKDVLDDELELEVDDELLSEVGTSMPGNC
jgi:hypothetical protein